MIKRIYLKELDCYQQATEEQRSEMHVRAERYFNLEGLPSDSIHRLLEEFIYDRGKQLAPSSLSSELLYYNNIRQFLIDKNIQTLIPDDEEKILRSLKGWMLENGYALASKKYRASYDKIGIETPGIVRHMKKILEFAKEDDNRDEQEKDVWDLDNFDFPILKNPIKNAKTLNFRKIMQPDIREEIKKVIFLHLKYKPLGTVQSEMVAINRFTGYIYNEEVRNAWCEAKRKQYRPCNGIDMIKSIEAEDKIIDLNITITRLEMKLGKMELYQKELIAENNRLKEELKKFYE